VSANANVAVSAGFGGHVKVWSLQDEQDDSSSSSSSASPSPSQWCLKGSIVGAMDFLPKQRLPNG
jgi:hypothetical protein